MIASIYACICTAAGKYSDLGNCDVRQRTSPPCSQLTIYCTVPSKIPSIPSYSPFPVLYLSAVFLSSKAAMENLTAYTAQAQSSPHTATISSDSLNDLLRLIGTQKSSVLSDPHGFRPMALLSPMLDSTSFQPAERNSQIQAHPPPGNIRQLSPHSLSTDMDVSAPQVAYHLDALGFVGQSDSTTQVSIHSHFPSM